MHTKGQVEFHHYTYRQPCLYSKEHSVGVLTEFHPQDKNAVDNARRLAALWNMADRLNLSTEFIEDGGVDEMVELVNLVDYHTGRGSLKDYNKDRIEILTQRIKDLSAACRNILSKMGR